MEEDLAAKALRIAVHLQGNVGFCFLHLDARVILPWKAPVFHCLPLLSSSWSFAHAAFSPRGSAWVGRSEQKPLHQGLSCAAASWLAT